MRCATRRRTRRGASRSRPVGVVSPEGGRRSPEASTPVSSLPCRRCVSAMIGPAGVVPTSPSRVPTSRRRGRAVRVEPLTASWGAGSIFGRARGGYAGPCGPSRPRTCTRPWATSRVRSARSPIPSPPATASRRSSARPERARRRRWRGRSRSSSAPRSSSRTTRRLRRSSATSSASSSPTTPSSTSSRTTTTSSPRHTSRRPTSTSRRTRRGTTTSRACGCRRRRRS